MANSNQSSRMEVPQAKESMDKFKMEVASELGVPLKKITSYIQNRNIDDLQNIFSGKQNEYKLQIDIMSRNILNLQTKINRLEKVKKIKTITIVIAITIAITIVIIKKMKQKF